VEEARILKLLEEGKITREEAELLLEALSEGKGQPAAEAAPESVETWIEIKARHADVRITEGAELNAVAFGPGQVFLDGNRVIAEQPRRGLWGLKTPRMRLEVRVPAGAGVALDLGMGQLEAPALVALQGSLGMGSVRLGRLCGLDFHLGQGDFKADLLVRGGRHRLEIGMGRARLRVLPGANLRLIRRIGLGHASSKPAMGLGETMVFGAGDAELKVEVGMGSVEVSHG